MRVLGPTRMVLTDCSPLPVYHGSRVAVRMRGIICVMNGPSYMSDSPFRSLSTTADWTDAQDQSEDHPVVVFKHSSACSVSGKANKELQRLAEDTPLPVYKLVVQESRALSDTIAEALDVRHETPQAIVLAARDPVFDASHFDVTAVALQEAVRSAPSSTN